MTAGPPNLRSTPGVADAPRVLAALEQPVVLVRHDREAMAIEYANGAFAALTGVRLDDLRGRDLGDVLTAVGGPGCRPTLASARTADAPMPLGTLHAPGAPAREYEVRGSRAARGDGPNDPDGPDDPEETVYVFDDVSDESRQRQRLASISTLAAGLCHDLNNLLMPIRGYVDAVQAAGLTDGQRDDVDSIRRVVDLLQQLSNSLRLFTLDPDVTDDPVVGTDLAAWWSDLEPLVTRALPAGISLQVSIPDDIPAVGVAPHRLSQAVLNLMINAGEAMDGPGVIRFSATADGGGDAVRLEVEDHGRGMSGETLRRAMEPFFTTKRRGRSTGLGLSIVHGIARAAGGRVELRSMPERGTTVILSLPSVPTEATAASPAGRGQRAVVSIDDGRIAACFTALLRSAGFAVEAGDEPASAVLWIVAPTDAALRHAQRRRAEEPPCRVLVYGADDGAWRTLGATVVDPDAGLPGIREAIRRIVLAQEPG